MNNFIFLVSTVLLIGSVFGVYEVFAEEIEPPLKQIKKTHPTNTVCKDDLTLRFKYNNKPVCMHISTIVKMETRNPEYFTLFNMGEYPLIGSWNPNLENRLIHDSDVSYSNEQPRPMIGSIIWNDEKTKYEIKYLMINGSDLIIYTAGLLQDPSDRHNWPIQISYRGNEDTILIFQVPDDLELENGAGMHIGQSAGILFPFVDPESKTNRQIIISDQSPRENGFVDIEFVLFDKDHGYELTESSMPTAIKYLSENSVQLDNLSKIYCNMKGGQHKDSQCLFAEYTCKDDNKSETCLDETIWDHECNAWDFYITSQCNS